jgi:branched-chain amino acid transport system ATP-binding protein
MSTLLRCVGVSMHFGAVKAVNDVNLEIETGELHAIIGPNGAGKTTLFNCISAEYTPSSGQVIFDGKTISGKQPHELPAYGISRSFQRTSVFPELTVAENVWMSAFARHGPQRIELIREADAYPQVREAVAQSLADVGLDGQAHVPAAELAHGDQRLLDFAIALAPRPRLLLLDEPMAGLSRHDTERVKLLIEKLKRQYTMILIEHKMEVIMSISDRITVMYFGEIMGQGTPEEIKANPKVREAYLGRRA